MVAKRLRTSKSSKAGLTFPVSKVHRLLKAYHRCNGLRISQGACVYTAAVIEYMAAELLELSGLACKALRKKRLVPRHLLLAIKNDAELENVLRKVTIPQAGVLPFISPALLPSSSVKTSAGGGATAAPTPRGGGRARAPPAVVAAVPATAARVHKAAPRPKAKKAAAAAAVAKGIAAAAPAAARATPQPRPKLNAAILSEKQLHGGQKLTVLKGDLTTVQADAIVHPTGASYATAGQVGRAIVARGGEPMRQAIRRLAGAGPLAPCAAKACPASGLGADWVINCHGPNWRQADAAGLVDSLEATAKNCLALAESNNFASIALPSIGSGSAGFPKQTAAQTILQTIRSYFDAQMASSIRQVYFVLYDQESTDVYTSELARMDA